MQQQHAEVAHANCVIVAVIITSVLDREGMIGCCTELLVGNRIIIVDKVCNLK
jgi:hypothetical protein